MDNGGALVTNDKDKAEMFNRLFSTVLGGGSF